MILSDKIICRGCNKTMLELCVCRCPDWVYKEKDIRHFIFLLKQEIANKHKDRYFEIVEIINWLAGDELI